MMNPPHQQQRYKNFLKNPNFFLEIFICPINYVYLRKETNLFYMSEQEFRHGFRSGWLIDSSGNPVNEADSLRDSTDAFGKRTAKNYKNVADIGSHYPHSPERHRLYLNGTQILLQYGSNAKFEDASDSYILKPAAGDNMLYRTAERFRYVVNYVTEVSAAFRTNQELQGDDKVIWGYGDPDIENDMANANGWFWEWRGGSPSNTVYLTTYRDGELVNSKTATTTNAITDWQRVEDEINWYNVGNRVARETYTEDGQQFNDIVGKTSVDGGKGPSRGNFPVVFAVVADATTTGLELETGSVGVNIIGNIEPVFRVKESIVSATHSGGGNWEPLFAIRRDPNKTNVFVNISDVQILEVSTDADVDVIAISVAPSTTDAGTFVTPPYHTTTNSAVQETTSITTFPDATGTSQTSSATIGGYQVGLTAYRTAGTGTANRRTNNVRGIRKRSIANGDYILVLAKTSTAMTIETAYETEQQW